MGCVGSEIQRSKPTLRAEKYGEANTFGGAGKPGQKFRNKEGREGEIESLANRIVDCVKCGYILYILKRCHVNLLARSFSFYKTLILLWDDWRSDHLIMCKHLVYLPNLPAAMWPQSALSLLLLYKPRRSAKSQKASTLTHRTRH